MSFSKIHFIHHFEKSYSPPNVGDWITSPYYYFINFFSKYICVLHSIWAIQWHEIEKGDVVIFGGGGLLDNSNELNNVINILFEKCNTVILWGVGTHKYNENNIFGINSTTVQLNLDKAVLCGIRDFNHPNGFSFVPCASCLHPAFNVKSEGSNFLRQIGVIKSALENSFAISNLPSFLTNAYPIGSIVEYINGSKLMLVSSYHAAYWSMLLGKKVILPISRLGVDKYKFFKYPVAFYDGDVFDENQILKLTEELPELPDFLNEARQLNLNFFEQVKTIIEERISTSSEFESTVIISKRNAQLEFTLLEVWNYVKILEDRIMKLENH
jgi:hypothetical protein